MAKTTATPRTIQELIDQTVAIGGEVVQTSERRYEFKLPCRVTSGAVRLVCRATVGYFVHDGKNVIKGVSQARSEIAYWAKQSRP